MLVRIIAVVLMSKVYEFRGGQALKSSLSSCGVGS